MYQKNNTHEGWLNAITIGLFIFLSLWWIYLFFCLHAGDVNANLIWAASYQIIALWGAIWGIVISLKWGGFKSIIGRAILFFSLGLLLQVFGQTIFSYYNLVTHVEIPYPSISDIGFFGSIPMYIYGIVLLGRASGVKMTRTSLRGKALAILLPALMLLLSYFFFLKGYSAEGSGFLKVFLDFGYPFGQAIYVSLAAVMFILSRNVLGGVMKKYILFVLVALLIQYIADYNFLYQALHQTWLNGGYGDFIYVLAYSLMAYSLIKLGHAFNHIKNS